MDRFLNTVIDDRYEIQSIIGIGGMAVVYKAIDRTNGNVVAIKIMKDELSSNLEFRRRFTTESKAIAMLSHPNIVQVYDVAVRDDIQYIVMEWVNGITLKEYIESRHRLSCEETIHFTVQILKALGHAHAKGIIHRDIKPQNIMLLENGTIKVADFGIAKFTNSDTKTMTDQTIGSVHYISPEQVKGTDVNEKSDIYSVGIMMYEMLTGKLPFDAPSAVTVALMQMQEKPVSPSEINPDIYQGLEEIILKAIEKKPEARYASTTDMLKDIRLFVKDPSISFGYTPYVDNEPTIAIGKMPKQKYVEEKEAEEKTGKDGLRPLIPIVSGILSALIIVSLIVVGIIVFSSSSNNNNTTGEVKVPNLVGKELAAISSDENYTKDFRILEIKQEYNDKYAAGVIISQDPAADTPVMPGSDIKVVISRGKDEIKVPDVTNLEYRQAGITLQKDYNLKYKEVREYSSDVIEGYVIRTEPKAGDWVKPGSEITLYVSLGKDMRTMPKLTGILQDEAQKRLTDNGLVLGNVNPVKSDEPAGTVIGQSAAEGSEIEAGTSIDIDVSVGPESSDHSSDVLITFPTDKDSFLVTIYVDGEEVLSEQHSSSEVNMTFTVNGTGTKYVEIYIDNELYGSKVVDLGY